MLTTPIIDTDSHVTEPPDLWTSRLSSKKWGDEIPHVYADERLGVDRWIVGGKRLTPVYNWTMAGFPEFPPSYPTREEDADAAGWDPVSRLERMDEYGISAQALYPNLLGFSIPAFLNISDPKLRIECVRAYNDFLVDFASVAPDRFIALTALPFWSVEDSVAEIARCKENGHRGILFMSKPHKIGMAQLSDPHWAPIFDAAQDLDLSVNFHVGFADISDDDFRRGLSSRTERAEYAKFSSMNMIGIAEMVADLGFSGLCHRHPSVKFVTVESGFGWLPYFSELMDWQWLNSGAAKAHPEREVPSFYIKRQVMSTYWFEREGIPGSIEAWQDNVMFETDFPHPTSLSPGPASSSEVPQEMARRSLEGVSEEVQTKVLYTNAANLYHVPSI